MAAGLPARTRRALGRAAPVRAHWFSLVCRWTGRGGRGSAARLRQTDAKVVALAVAPPLAWSETSSERLVLFEVAAVRDRADGAVAGR